MVMTPRTTNRPCFLRNVLGSSPWAKQRAPGRRVDHDDAHQGNQERRRDQDEVERGCAAPGGNAGAGDRGHVGDSGHRIPAVTSPSLAPLPALVSTSDQGDLAGGRRSHVLASLGVSPRRPQRRPCGAAAGGSVLGFGLPVTMGPTGLGSVLFQGGGEQPPRVPGHRAACVSQWNGSPRRRSGGAAQPRANRDRPRPLDLADPPLSLHPVDVFSDDLGGVAGNHRARRHLVA